MLYIIYHRFKKKNFWQIISRQKESKLVRVASLSLEVDRGQPEFIKLPLTDEESEAQGIKLTFSILQRELVAESGFHFKAIALSTFLSIV